MPFAAPSMPAGQNLIAALDEAVAAAEALFADGRRAVAARVTVEGRPMAQGVRPRTARHPRPRLGSPPMSRRSGSLRLMPDG